MFEGLPMIMIDLEHPIKNSNYQGRLKNYTGLSNNNECFCNAVFVLSGKKIQTVLSLPTASQPSGNFIYLQAFVSIEGDSSFYTRRRNFTSYMLSYTCEGTGTLEYEGKSYELRPGDGFLIDCQKEHFYKTSGDGWHHYDLHFYGGNSELLYKEFQKTSSARFACENISQFQSLLMQVLKSYSQPSSHMEYFVSDSISSLIRYILQENEKKTPFIPEDYHYLLKYMENNYNHDLSIEHLSSFFGISRYHLSREFKKYTGFSPMDYIIELRINHAKFLLSNTDIPAYRIGELVGISNEANFLRLFKKRTGQTPGQFRKSVFI